ncbi:MAG: universal stress protein [Candidatus Melainabacteria bacterium]|nr:universal stress protein [Candidatus Melainabacteria bacterium]
MKSILIAMDESKSSGSALNVGIALARICGAKVKGLYVEDIMRLLEWQPVELMGAAVGVTSGIPHSRPTLEQVEVEKQFIAEANKLEKSFKEECKKFAVSHNFFTKRGNVHEVIEEMARTVDMVVVGRRGKTYPESSKEPGPVTEDLLRVTTRPVLVVPENAKVNNKILIAYDGSQNSQRALSIGATFAKLLNSEVIVISVANDIDAAQKPLDEAEEFLAPYELNTKYVVDFGAAMPWIGIAKQIKIFNPGLIVIGAFGENRFMELIFGSTTKNVLMEATCPVLLCR